MKTLDTTHKLYTRKDAEEAVTALQSGEKECLQSGEKEWSFVAVHSPEKGGKSFIEIFDEDGLFVGRI